MKNAYGAKRRYYTEYVNHMIRFYMSCPDGIDTREKTKSEISNWVSVNTALVTMNETEKDLIRYVYSVRNVPFHEVVAKYCNEKGANEKMCWIIIQKISDRIARYRGLI